MLRSAGKGGHRLQAESYCARHSTFLRVPLIPAALSSDRFCPLAPGLDAHAGRPAATRLSYSQADSERASRPTRSMASPGPWKNATKPPARSGRAPPAPSSLPRRPRRSRSLPATRPGRQSASRLLLLDARGRCTPTTFHHPGWSSHPGREPQSLCLHQSSGSGVSASAAQPGRRSPPTAAARASSAALERMWPSSTSCRVLCRRRLRGGDQGEAGIAAEEAGEGGVALAALAVLLALEFDGGLVGQVAQVLEVQEHAGGQGEADGEGVVRAGGVPDLGPPADQRHLCR